MDRALANPRRRVFVLVPATAVALIHKLRWPGEDS